MANAQFTQGIEQPDTSGRLEVITDLGVLPPMTGNSLTSAVSSFCEIL